MQRELASANAEARAVWERIAAWWDEQCGEGDDFHTHLIHPFLDTCLQLPKGSVLLDLACGNGSLSRRFARRGIKVTAVDFSETFLTIARKRSASHLPIEFVKADLTDREDLQRIPSIGFDAALCSMALHNLGTIEPLLNRLAQVLKPSGAFVCSVPHPCFNSTPGLSMLKEDDFSPPVVTTTYSMRVKNYLSTAEFNLSAKKDQPEPHYNVHRPLQDILGHCFRAGFRMNAVFEPSGALLPAEIESRWKDAPEIPPVLVMSFELATPRGTPVGDGGS